ncbi:MAG: MATE family efflux transporter [Rhodanobacteraceae bacterium]|nr:MATE family efflux transporter [Rhodanobacteraceae bacterium]MBP9154200.1 MATE family efflux transporter [Xanthomonadales bacterium]HQW81649.1 MATE family efflux transporter [Pseudomonadota bacterium]
MRQNTPFRDELGEVGRLALPLVIGQLLAMLMNVADTILGGQHGPHTLAVIAVGSAVWSLVLICCLGLLFAIPPNVAQRDGAGRRDEIAPLLSQALWIAWAIGLALLILLRVASLLLDAMAVDPSLRADTAAFLKAASWGAPGLATFFALRFFCEGLGYTRATLYFSAMGLLVLIPLGYGLIFGRFGFTEHGAVGAGIALAWTVWLQAIAMAAFVLRHPRFADLHLLQGFTRPRWSLIRDLLSLGLPIAIMILMEGSLFVVTALLIGSLGANAVASHQVAINVASITFMVPLGIGMATTVRVGHAVGAGDAQRARGAAGAGLLLAITAQVLSATMLALFSPQIAALYTSDVVVGSLAAQLMMYAAIFQFSDGLQVVAASALRGLKDARVPALLTAIAYWGIGMSTGWYCAFRLGRGAPGMWVGLIAGLTAAATLLLVRLFLRLRRLPRDIGHLATVADEAAALESATH